MFAKMFHLFEIYECNSKIFVSFFNYNQKLADVSSYDIFKFFLSLYSRLIFRVLYLSRVPTSNSKRKFKKYELISSKKFKLCSTYYV